ncbi:MAG: hypothetical protein JWP76_4079, partial [Dactylosporangium sp.]|nr:hypothetical protein [Dactylosporangium sp.]
SGQGLREQSRALANSLRMAVGLYRLTRSPIGGTAHVR